MALSIFTGKNTFPAAARMAVMAAVGEMSFSG